MRTTVRLPDDLFREVKRHAAETGRTLTEVIEDSLRQALARGRQRVSHEEPFRVPTFRGTGLRPGIDLDDTASLLDVLDDEDDDFR